MDVIDHLLPTDARLLSEVFAAADSCVDVTITSPPYWNLKDYGTPNQIGHGQTKEEYLADMKKVLEDCLLATKPTGSLWLVVDTYREDGELQILPLEMAERARQVGWKLRELIVWDKQYNVPWQKKGQLRNIFEFILFMTKSNDYKYYVQRVKTLDEISKWWVDFPERFNPKGKTPTNIWSIPIRPRGAWRKPSKLDHYCSFPTALIARIIELTTDPGDLVMDPFAGSGVVLAQAAAMARHYIGCEINKKYVRMFEKTVRKEVAAEWEAMKTWRKTQLHSKIDFEQTIMKLRALKFVRQVTRPFIELLGAEKQADVRAILCMASIPKGYKSGRPVDVKVLIVVDRLLPDFKQALERARARASQPPLTQYEIRPDIQVTTYSNLKRRTKLLRHKLFLYPTYKPRKYTASGTLRSWLQKGCLRGLSEDSKIPMLASFGVDVEWVLKK